MRGPQVWVPSDGEEEPVVLFGAKRRGVCLWSWARVNVAPNTAPVSKDEKANPNPRLCPRTMTRSMRKTLTRQLMITTMMS